MDNIEELISKFLETLKAGRNVEAEVISIRDKKFLLIKETGRGIGVANLANGIDAEHPGEVLQDKKQDLNELRKTADNLTKLNRALVKIFVREHQFDEEEVNELKQAGTKLAEEERKIIEFYRQKRAKVRLNPSDIKLLEKTTQLAEGEEREREKILSTLAAIKSIYDTCAQFGQIIENENTVLANIVKSAEALLSSFTSGGEQARHVTAVKKGVNDFLLEFKKELSMYFTLSKNVVARNKIIGELKQYEEQREAKRMEVADVSKGKLRVLLIPCNWGFGPVSKSIAIINSMKNIDSVLEKVGIIASEDICRAAKRGYSKIKIFQLNENNLYDRTDGVNYDIFQKRVANFIDFCEQAIIEFKPNLIIDSLGYLGAIISKIHEIPVIKLDHLFPELSSRPKDEELGIRLFENFEVSRNTPKLREFKNQLVKYSNLRSFEWLGDVLCDYLIVPAFYQIEVTASVVKYRNNRNIFFVNPSMNRQTRLLMDDIFGVNIKVKKTLARVEKMFGKQDFSRFILINTGGIFNESEYPQAWTVFINEISAIVNCVVSLNKTQQSKIGVVIVGTFGTSEKFQDYIAKNWIKEMRDVLVLSTDLRFFNTIRLYLSCDLIVTNAGQTSISELISLNKPFLLLSPYQTEMKRNYDYCVKSGIGIALPQNNRNFNEALGSLMVNSQLTSKIKSNQIVTVSGLNEFDDVLIKIIGDFIGKDIIYASDEDSSKDLTVKVPDQPWNKKFSVVIPIMDKDPKFLDNCLFFLRKAESSSEYSEIIVVDFESNPGYYKEYEILCRKYDAKIYRINKRGRLFNAGLLKNYGARKATGDYIVWCDVDTLIPSNTFSRVREILRKSPKTLLIGRIFYDNKFREPNFYKSLTDYQMRELALNDKLMFMSRGFSGFVVCDKEWVYESRGFDESYVYWGGEDYDFWFRSIFIKRKSFKYLDHFEHFTLEEVQKGKGRYPDKFLPSDLIMLHQTHRPTYRNPDPRIQKILQLKEARTQRLKVNRKIAPNSENWGTNKIKVLRIVSDFIVGGVAGITIKQCEVMIKDGNFDVRLVIAKPHFEKKYVNSLKVLGVEVRVAEKEYGVNLGVFCQEEVIDFKPEILLITNLREGAAQLKAVKEIFQEMKVVFRGTSSATVGVAYMSLYNWADAYVCLSKGMADIFSKRIKGFDRKRAFILGNGIEDSFFAIKTSNKNKVCILARTDPAKGLLSFVNIINSVKKEILDVEGIIIGGAYEKDTNSIQCYQSVVRRIKETNAPVKFTGIVDQDDVRKYISQCKVLLFTSIREGFPNGFWQGVASGLVPVTTSVGNIGEALAGNKNVFLCDLPIDDSINNELPQIVESDLTKKCVQALRTDPNLTEIKSLAMPYKEELWSIRFIGFLKNLVGIGEIDWENDGTKKTTATKQIKKVKVLRIIPSLIIGGLELTAMVECHVLSKNGYDVTLLVASPHFKTEFVEEMTKAGVNVITNNKYSKKDWINVCDDWITKNNPNIILISGVSFLSDKINQLRQKLNFKVAYRITSSHDHAIAIANSYRWVDLEIVLHKTLGEILKRKIPEIKKVNFAVLGNPIKKEFFSLTPSNDNTICMATRLSPEKCLVSFVNIIAEIRKEVTNVRGMIIGGANELPESQDTLKLIESRIAETNAPIIITGFTDRVKDYLVKSKVYLSTSATEGFQNGLWEGIAIGLIPVVTSVGNVPDTLVNRKDAYVCSFLVPEENKNILPSEAEKDLAKKCIQALKSKPDVNAIKQLAMPYHIDVWSRRFLEIIQGLLDGDIIKQEPIGETISIKAQIISKSDPVELNLNSHLKLEGVVTDIPKGKFKYKWLRFKVSKAEDINIKNNALWKELRNGTVDGKSPNARFAFEYPDSKQESLANDFGIGNSFLVLAVEVDANQFVLSNPISINIHPENFEVSITEINGIKNSKNVRIDYNQQPLTARGNLKGIGHLYYSWQLSDQNDNKILEVPWRPYEKEAIFQPDILTAGRYKLALIGTEHREDPSSVSAGKLPVDTVTIEILAQQRPSIQIDSPKNGQVFGQNGLIEFSATINNLDIPSGGYMYRWWIVDPISKNQRQIGGMWGYENKIKDRIPTYIMGIGKHKVMVSILGMSGNGSLSSELIEIEIK